MLGKKNFRYVLQKVQDQDILVFGKQDRELELFPSLQSSLNVQALRFIFPSLVYTAYVSLFYRKMLTCPFGSANCFSILRTLCGQIYLLYHFTLLRWSLKVYVSMQINKLSNVKEEVYGALDSFIAWDLEFPLITVKKALKTLEDQREWKRIIQVFFFNFGRLFLSSSH